MRVARGRKPVQFCPPACSRSDGVTTPPSPSADTEWQSGHVWQQRSSARQDHAAAAAAARAAPELLPAQSPCSSASVSIPSGQTGTRGAGRVGSPRVCTRPPDPPAPGGVPRPPPEGRPPPLRVLRPVACTNAGTSVPLARRLSRWTRRAALD